MMIQSFCIHWLFDLSNNNQKINHQHHYNLLLIKWTNKTLAGEPQNRPYITISSMTRSNNNSIRFRTRATPQPNNSSKWWCNSNSNLIAREDKASNSNSRGRSGAPRLYRTRDSRMVEGPKPTTTTACMRRSSNTWCSKLAPRPPVIAQLAIIIITFRISSMSCLKIVAMPAIWTSRRRSSWVLVALVSLYFIN